MKMQKKDILKLGEKTLQYLGDSEYSNTYPKGHGKKGFRSKEKHVAKKIKVSFFALVVLLIIALMRILNS